VEGEDNPLWRRAVTVDLRSIVNKYLFILPLLISSLASPVVAKEWARKMFSTLSHDFETVARGAVVEFDFEFENIYEEEFHISAVRSSCGCTSPTVINPSLKTWEKGRVHAKFNTRNFLGEKKATITVVIDKPYPAEVQLNVRGFIRQDVVVHPGEVEFGDVDAGSSAQQSVKIVYAGRNSWRLRDVETPNDYYDIKLREQRRGGGRVEYEMLVKMKGNVPVGHLTDQFVLVTNDNKLGRIPLTVKGNVQPSVTVSPASLPLGNLQPGQRVTRQIVVRAKRPFQVTDVYCDGDCLTFKNPSGAKKLHFIPVTFTATDEPGDLAMTIHVETDLGSGAKASCKATASVRSTESADNKAAMR
jgi:hypothetical protein